ncbi:MAG: hypothetical protein PVJ33_13005 [Lysobacterales bacterium]|jgi:hypothetical protein
MNLSPMDRLYLEKRERMVRYWPWAGGALLLALLALAGWMWWNVPHLVNPWAVSMEIRAGTLSEASTLLMAAMLPVLALTFLVFAVVVVVLGFAVAANERRLLRMLRRTGPGADG